MNVREQAELKKRYIAATDSFVSKVKDDPNVIAVIICGSLAYDHVWEKSDIDMTLIIRDQHLQKNNYCIIEDDITINVQLIARSVFKRSFEKMIGGSIPQSYFAKGSIIYTTDDSLFEYFEEIKTLGSHDIALSLLQISCELVDIYRKCQKWLTVKKDPLYAQYYLLKAAELIAKMEVCSQGEPPIRESIQKILEKNPELLAPFYMDAMSRYMGEAEIHIAIERMGSYLDQKLEIIQQPVIEFMADQEIKTVTLFVQHFQMVSHYLISILEYLAEKGVIEKVSQTIRITPKSKPSLEEIGFLYIP
ncbi:MAG: nucleotidyltransferase [Gorillibacterium sp.]|nr:nucleotidyltransferase [Gorillibacterium sp.]